ncbi:MAG: hypothetical protein EOO40_04890, partial [Deltaproteobacteria bacterium]
MTACVTQGGAVIGPPHYDAAMTPNSPSDQPLCSDTPPAPTLRGLALPEPSEDLNGWLAAFREYLVFEKRASPHTVVAYCADIKALFV